MHQPNEIDRIEVGRQKFTGYQGGKREHEGGRQGEREREGEQLYKEEEEPPNGNLTGGGEQTDVEPERGRRAESGGRLRFWGVTLD